VPCAGPDDDDDDDDGDDGGGGDDDDADGIAADGSLADIVSRQ
jgi:hypothetical protein